MCQGRPRIDRSYLDKQSIATNHLNRVPVLHMGRLRPHDMHVHEASARAANLRRATEQELGRRHVLLMTALLPVNSNSDSAMIYGPREGNPR